MPAVAGSGEAFQAGDQITVNFSLQITAGPGTDGSAIVQALRDYMPEFEGLMRDYFGERYRTGFSSMSTKRPIFRLSYEGADINLQNRINFGT